MTAHIVIKNDVVACQQMTLFSLECWMMMMFQETAVIASIYSLLLWHSMMQYYDINVKEHHRYTFVLDAISLDKSWDVSIHVIATSNSACTIKHRFHP